MAESGSPFAPFAVLSLVLGALLLGFGGASVDDCNVSTEATILERHERDYLTCDLRVQYNFSGSSYIRQVSVGCTGSNRTVLPICHS